MSALESVCSRVSITYMEMIVFSGLPQCIYEEAKQLEE